MVHPPRKYTNEMTPILCCNPECANFGAAFIRADRTSRLAPLCKRHLREYTDAAPKLAGRPIGKVVFQPGVEVSLADGAQEYASQAPKGVKPQDWKPKRKPIQKTKEIDGVLVDVSMCAVDDCTYASVTPVDSPQPLCKRHQRTLAVLEAWLKDIGEGRFTWPRL